MSLETRDEREARAKVVEEAKRVEQMFHDAKLTLLEQTSSAPADGPLYTDVPPERWTLPMLLDAWGEDMRPFDLTEYRETERAVTRFVQVMGHLPVSQVTPVTLRRFKRKLETQPHHGTRKPLDYRAIAATMTDFRKLLRWYKDGIEGRRE